jgi:hypothetical protein
MVRRNSVIIMLSQHAGGGPLHPNGLSDPEGEAWEDCNGYRLCFGHDTEGDG